MAEPEGPAYHGEPPPEPVAGAPGALPAVPPGPGQMRASDRDRDQVAEALRDAAGDGRLTLGELEDRLELVFAARTYAELERVTGDLPASRPQPLGPPPAAVRMSAVFGEEKRAGRWEVPALIEAKAIFGSVELDLSEAVARTDLVVVEATVVFGELTVVVPEGVAVDLEPGSTVFGERKAKVNPPEGVPTLTVRVRGSVTFGEIGVRHPKVRRRWLTG